jgi:hypothetical protein
LQQSNRQDYVIIWPPGISDGTFQLRMDNIWFCKVLLLFSIDTMTDKGMQTYEMTRMYLPLGLVGQVKEGSSCLTWTAWVQFLPFPQRSLPALLMGSIN